MCDRNESQSLIWGFEKIISHFSSSHPYIICIAEEQITFGSSQGSGPVTSAAPQPYLAFQKVWAPAQSSCISCTLRGTPRPLQVSRVSESPCGIPGIVLPTPAQTKMPTRSLAPSLIPPGPGYIKAGHQLLVPSSLGTALTSSHARLSKSFSHSPWHHCL